jgi:outer membrane protein assembly factor BamB
MRALLRAGGARRAGRACRALAAMGLVLTSTGCWPMPGHGPDRHAHNPYETEITAESVAGLTPLWSATIGRRWVNDPVISRGGVHVTTSGSFPFPGACSITTLDPATGEARWRRSLHPSGQDCSEVTPLVQASAGDPYVDGDRVIFGAVTSGSGGYSTPSESYDVVTGEPLGNPHAGVVAAQRGPVLAAEVGYFDPVWQAIKTGARITSPWGRLDLAIPSMFVVPPDTVAADVPIQHGVADSVTLGTDKLFDAGEGPLTTVPGQNHRGQGVRAYSITQSRAWCLGLGAHYPLQECPLWATPVDGRVVVRPVVGDGGATVYAGTDTTPSGVVGGSMYALDAATGWVRWRVPVGSPVSASPALANGRLYVPTRDALVVLDARTGTRLWEGPAGDDTTGRLMEQPAVAGDVVFVGASRSLVAFDADGCGAATCDPLWTGTVAGGVNGAPAVSGGRVFVGSSGGVVAFGLREDGS